MNSNVASALIAIAALLMAVATGLGAYASHGLDAILEPDALNSFKTAVDYQFVHALGLIGVAIYGERHPEAKGLILAARLLLLGILLFCGGVYISSLDGPGLLVHSAPVGGVCLIVGWLVVAFGIGLSRLRTGAAER